MVSQLNTVEQSGIKKLIFESLRALTHKEFDFTNKFDFQIHRSEEGKPYLVSTKKLLDFGIIINVSRHGDYVCIAADHESLVWSSISLKYYQVGVDIVDIYLETQPQ